MQDGETKKRKKNQWDKVVLGGTPKEEINNDEVLCEVKQKVYHGNRENEIYQRKQTNK